MNADSVSLKGSPQHPRVSALICGPIFAISTLGCSRQQTRQGAIRAIVSLGEQASNGVDPDGTFDSMQLPWFR